MASTSPLAGCLATVSGLAWLSSVCEGCGSWGRPGRIWVRENLGGTGYVGRKKIGEVPACNPALSGARRSFAVATHKQYATMGTRGLDEFNKSGVAELAFPGRGAFGRKEAA